MRRDPPLRRGIGREPVEVGEKRGWREEEIVEGRQSARQIEAMRGRGWKTRAMVGAAEKSRNRGCDAREESVNEGKKPGFSVAGVEVNSRRLKREMMRASVCANGRRVGWSRLSLLFDKGNDSAWCGLVWFGWGLYRQRGRCWRQGCAMESQGRNPRGRRVIFFSVPLFQFLLLILRRGNCGVLPGVGRSWIGEAGHSDTKRAREEPLRKTIWRLSAKGREKVEKERKGESHKVDFGGR